MFAVTEAGRVIPDHAPLSDIGLRQTVGELLSRGSDHIPPELDGIKIEFTTSIGVTYRGELRTDAVLISKTTPATSDGQWAGHESGIAHSNGVQKPTLTYTKTGNADFRIQEGNLIPRDSEGARAGMEKIAGEFFDALDSNPTKPSTTN